MVVASYSETLRILCNMNFSVPLYETGLYRTPNGILQFPVQMFFFVGISPAGGGIYPFIGGRNLDFCQCCNIPTVRFNGKLGEITATHDYLAIVDGTHLCLLPPRLRGVLRSRQEEREEGEVGLSLSAPPSPAPPSQKRPR